MSHSVCCADGVAQRTCRVRVACAADVSRVSAGRMQARVGVCLFDDVGCAMSAADKIVHSALILPLAVSVIFRRRLHGTGAEDVLVTAFALCISRHEHHVRMSAMLHFLPVGLALCIAGIHVAAVKLEGSVAMDEPSPTCSKSGI